MGHEAPHVSGRSCERISDERLKAVSARARKWLFGEEKDAKGEEQARV